MKHYVYARSINKVPIDGANLLYIQIKRGKVTTVNGDVHPAAEEGVKGNTQAKITKEEALSNACKHIKLTKSDTLVKVDGNTLDRDKRKLRVY